MAPKRKSAENIPEHGATTSPQPATKRLKRISAPSEIASAAHVFEAELEELNRLRNLQAEVGTSSATGGKSNSEEKSKTRSKGKGLGKPGRKARLRDFEPTKGYLVEWRDGRSPSWESIASVMKMWKEEHAIKEGDIIKAQEVYAERQAAEAQAAADTTVDRKAETANGTEQSGEVHGAVQHESDDEHKAKTPSEALHVNEAKPAKEAAQSRQSKKARPDKENDTKKGVTDKKAAVAFIAAQSVQENVNSATVGGHHRLEETDPVPTSTAEFDPRIDPPIGLRGDVWSEVLWRIDWLLPRLDSKAKVAERLEEQNVSLPPGWCKVESQSNPGKHYYFNKATGETKWYRPMA